MAQNLWKIHKFGGSSLVDADCFRRVAKILTDQPDARVGAVVSAMGGMTDKLLRLAVLAEQEDESYASELHLIGDRYAGTARELIKGDALVSLLDDWGQDAADIGDILRSIAETLFAQLRFWQGEGERLIVTRSARPLTTWPDRAGFTRA